MAILATVLFTVAAITWHIHLLTSLYPPPALHTIHRKPEVCILIPTTSASQPHWSTLEHTPLYQYPLQSIATTCEPSNFTYRVLIGHDDDDPLFGSESMHTALHTWATRHLQFASLTIHPIRNRAHKPGPVMNNLSSTAHASGCDYLYRINDDTELASQRWTSAFVAALAAFRPPNVGVVGPTCHEGNTAIMTHDFVHRTHRDIFPWHYPPELTDWWLDDWISLVYSPTNTLKLPGVVVRHHTVATRYAVAWGADRLLPALAAKGNATIAQYLKSSGKIETIRGAN
jgi:hypothetical protein